MAKKAMRWAYIESGSDIFAWRTEKGTYDGIEEELGVKEQDDLPDARGKLIRSSSEIDKVVPKIILGLQDGDSIKSIVRRIDPTKLKSVFDKVGQNGFTYKSKRIVSANVIE